MKHITRFLSLLCFGAALSGSAQIIPLTIENHDFETGDLTGWIEERGTIYVLPDSSTDWEYPGAGEGIYSTWAGENSADWKRLSQRIDISSYGSAIDSGNVTTTFTALGYSNFTDAAILTLDFYDAASGGNSLRQATAQPLVDGVWGLVSIVGSTVPVGTRSIKITLAFLDQIDQDIIYAGFDDVAGVIAIPEPGAYPTIIGVLAFGLALWVRRRVKAPPSAAL